MAETQSNQPLATGEGPALSVVIPAFNEAGRIEQCLTQVLAFVAARNDRTEVILADDGSTDDTRSIAERFADIHPELRILACPHRGKAGTVRAGFQAATGQIVMFTDADLATPLHYADDLIGAIHGGAEVAIASREGIGAVRVGEPAHRHLMGRAFNRLVQSLLLPGIEDTQCGFKAFRRDAATEIFQVSLLHRADRPDIQPRVTAFDVELLYVARRLGMTIAVLPVVWSAGTGSKVSPVRDTWTNLMDVFTIRINAWRGRYPVPHQSRRTATEERR